MKRYIIKVFILECALKVQSVCYCDKYMCECTESYTESFIQS